MRARVEAIYQYHWVNNMNWSMYTANRATHLKIVVVGLAAAR